MSETEFTVAERWAALEALQKHYKKFGDFLYDVMTDLLGFECSPIQLDIAEYLQHGPLYRMIQAQRGQAKTTITAIYAVWRIIHDPTTRVLIISAGGDQATEISNWIIQIINGMEELACLRPDKSHGDRASVKAFDIHYELKGPEKSPSIACIGITANMQGKRADLLIPDDIESSKNSQTAVQRERIQHLTKDFTSICTRGDIVWLGTPQSVDSVYNSLPGRGYDIRIWPGRYPTLEEEVNYGPYLAPSLKTAMENNPRLRTGGGPLGDRGQATDKVIVPEETLCKKQLDQGNAYFQLQYMLDTRLADKDRYPLKNSKIIFMHVPRDRAPMVVNWMQSEAARIIPANGFPVQDKFYAASGYSNEYGAFQGCHMYVDPAGGGQNGDETSYAVSKFLAGKVCLVDVGGVPGGLEADKLALLTAVAKKWEPDVVQVEENYGKGALRTVWQPSLLREVTCGLEDVWNTGQKELRIIDILEPVIGSGRLIVDQALIESDWQACQKYPPELRAVYCTWFQVARLTRDKGSLVHDDRVEAIAGTVAYWTDHLAQDEHKAQVAAANKNYENMVKNPLGNGRSLNGINKPTAGRSILSRLRRR